jgi:hypothetical protein
MGVFLRLVQHPCQRFCSCWLAVVTFFRSVSWVPACTSSSSRRVLLNVHCRQLKIAFASPLVPHAALTSRAWLPSHMTKHGCKWKTNTVDRHRRCAVVRIRAPVFYSRSRVTARRNWLAMAFGLLLQVCLSGSGRSCAADRRPAPGASPTRHEVRSDRRPSFRESCLHGLSHKASDPSAARRRHCHRAPGKNRTRKRRRIRPTDSQRIRQTEVVREVAANHPHHRVALSPGGENGLQTRSCLGYPL